LLQKGTKVFAMMTTTATDKETGKRVTLKTADLFRIENETIVEH
jgi:predicted SnoaL-like aldol condensation-catalyzing enzyme